MIQTNTEILGEKKNILRKFGKFLPKLNLTIFISLDFPLFTWQNGK